LNSIVPDAVQTITPVVGLTKLERIKAVAGDCGADMEHSIHVTELSLMLFDGLRSLHCLDDIDRDLLEYAGVLHDIGWKDGQKDHHKTSLRMILADDRLPLDGAERAIVANVARYHRGGMPDEKHKAYGMMGAADRSKVDRLASIMRLADGLDVSHSSVVRSVECHNNKGNVMIILQTNGSPDREMQKIGKKKDLFERTFRKALTVEWESS
jgi:exopolyphosphatase/pppGpp-phosphohydrolase